jgi:hypothetical protein
MVLLYKPFSMIARAVASRLGTSAFRGLWATVDDGEPPGPRLREAGLAKVVAAAALEAATMAAAAALADRASARVFEHLFGVWPGEKTKED